MSSPERLGKGTEIHPLFVGVDVGGTKVAAAVVDESGRLSGRVQEPTNTNSPEETLDGVAHTVERSMRAAGVGPSRISAVGLGIPGKVDPAAGRGVLSVNLGWRDVPVRESLEQALQLPCWIENDVKVAALGEWRFGAGRGLRNFVYLTIGTGIEAGLILDGKLFRGSTGMSGEIGHAVVDPLGPVCKCGGRGCLEAVAAGPAIQARGASIANLPPEAAAGEARALAGQAPAAAVFEAAACGDQSAREIIQEICKYLGLATQWLIMAFDPQLIVLAGGVTQTGQPFLDAVNRQLVSLAEDSFVFREVLAQTSVQLSKLGQDAGVLGAAALAAEATTPGDEA